MLKEFDMELVLRQNFYNFFLERRYNTEDLNLMFKMQAFDKTEVCFLNRLIVTSETQLAWFLALGHNLLPAYVPPN